MANKSGSMVTFRVNSTALNKKINEALRTFQHAPATARRANLVAVTELAEHAAGILTDQIHREPDPRHARLADLITDPEIHTATVTGFAFFVFRRAEAADARRFAYFRAIEYGSKFWVGREPAPFLFFLGSPNAPTRGINNQAAFAGRLDPESRAGRRNVKSLIKKAISPYAYLETAIKDFQGSGRYPEILREEFARDGIDLSLLGRKKA